MLSLKRPVVSERGRERGEDQDVARYDCGRRDRLVAGHGCVCRQLQGYDRHLARLRGSLPRLPGLPERARSEEHTSELQSLMRISYAVFCLKKKNNTNIHYMREQEKIIS